MNRTAVICLSSGSFLLAVCIILTVFYRVFHVRLGDMWSYTGIGCAIAGILVLVVGLKHTGQ